MTPRGRDRLAALVLAGAPTVFVLLVGGIAAALSGAGIGEIDGAFLSGVPADAGRAGGIAPMIASTLGVLAVGLAASAPVGLIAGIYLAEYARGGGALLRGALDLLAAVPSVVYGLFGLAFFCEALGLGWSLWSGGLTVAVMLLPLYVRLCEAGLRAVPDGYRAAGFALGLPRWVILRRVLLPRAAPALAAALVLATGRVLSESAIFLFTSGTSTRMPGSLGDPGRVLAVHVYAMAVEVPRGEARAAAAGVVLLAAVLGTTLAARALPRLLVAR